MAPLPLISNVAPGVVGLGGSQVEHNFGAPPVGYTWGLGASVGSTLTVSGVAAAEYDVAFRYVLFVGADVVATSDVPTEAVTPDANGDITVYASIALPQDVISYPGQEVRFVAVLYTTEAAIGGKDVRGSARMQVDQNEMAVI